MRTIIQSITVAFGFLAIGFLASGEAYAAKKAVIDARVTEAVKLANESLAEFPALHEKAKGMLVIPSIKEGGLVFAGAYGEGALIVDGKTKGYYSYSKASAGFQAGFERHDMILLFLTDEALKEFEESEGWQGGVEGKLTLVNTGAQAGVDTTTEGTPVVAYVFGQEGVLGGVSVSGGKFHPIKPD